METKTLPILSPEHDDGRIHVGNLIFKYIDSTSSFKIEPLVGFDALILDASDPDFTHRVMKKLRGHYNPEFYLKPIFLINYRQTQDPIVENLHDGVVFSFDQLNEMRSKVNELFMLTTQLSPNIPTGFEAQIFKRTINFLYSRERKVLTPILDPSSVIGYSYPEISVGFDREEGSQVLTVLDWAEKEGLIWPDFSDRIYLCNTCSSGLLSYREVCPHCNSSHLNSQDLVHHFPCAHVAPMSEFRSSIDGTMTCPKCNKQLRHIGVDYDKPSIINTCNSCSSSFQDVFVKAKCLVCRNDSDVQYLVSRNLYQYKFTKKGRTAAANGLFSSGEEISDVFGAVSKKTLETMLHYDFERLRRVAGTQLHIAAVYFENLYELNARMGAKAQKQLLTELVQLVREDINPQDYLSVDGTNLFLIVLHDVEVKRMETMVADLELNLETLLSKNFPGFAAAVRTSKMPINTQEAVKVQLERMAQQLYL
jgi:GGDEF domain-containing protein